MAPCHPGPGSLFLTLPLPQMLLDDGYLSSKTGDAPSCPYLLHSVANVRAHPVCASVSFWVHMRIIIPFEILHWMSVRIK